MENITFGFDEKDQDAFNIIGDCKSQQIQKQDGSEVRMFIQTESDPNDQSETRF